MITAATATVGADMSLMGAAAPPAAPPEWASIKSPFYELNFAAGKEADAKKIQGFLDSGIAALKQEFSEFPVEELLRVDCKIYLHPAATAEASESTAQIETGGHAESYYARIHFLTPSAYPASYRSNVNEPASDDYWHKLTVHEYSTILFDRIAQSKKDGWTFFNAPRWFVDGYEEYAGLMLSSPRNRTEILRKYLEMERRDHNRMDFDFGVNVQDPYVDGSMLLLFMNETFGREKVHAILTSGERRFGKAISGALGVSVSEFGARWQTWLTAGAGGR